MLFLPLSFFSSVLLCCYSCFLFLLGRISQDYRMVCAIDFRQPVSLSLFLRIGLFKDLPKARSQKTSCHRKWASILFVILPIQCERTSNKNNQISLESLFSDLSSLFSLKVGKATISRSPTNRHFAVEMIAQYFFQHIRCFPSFFFSVVDCLFPSNRP